jgi:hypothetical protein
LKQALSKEPNRVGVTIIYHCVFRNIEDLRKMRIIGWRGKARRRDEWKSVLREVKVLQGP